MTSVFQNDAGLKHVLDLIRRNRLKILSVAEELPSERLTRIPDGFRNNILWNIGHIAVAQQVLCYKLSGLPMRVPPEAAALFGKGSSPAEWTSVPDPAEVKGRLIPLLDALEEDIARGAFTEYRPYETSMGNVLTSLPQALDYVLWHEGLHLGAILALRKLV